MNSIDDFTIPEGWTFNRGCRPTKYPLGHVLIITKSPLRADSVDLTWIDPFMSRDELLGITFKNGCIDGQTSDNFIVKVELEAGQLTGTVGTEPFISPEPGTWGAETNGGWEEKA